ncbi:MAG: filamentous hemagglutinin N-terminal domain-containing protein [Planctomycetota bacterium]|nr:filamentous hemagglutinin N-terminal domain-containing protein [Planctomycetota bacterium]
MLKRPLAGLAALQCLCTALALGTEASGPQVVGGSATIQQNGSNLTVTTGSNKTVINWNSFGVPQGGTANFIQPGSNSAVLNRVTGGMPSRIDGSLLSNGRVYLINPSGVVVGATGVINTAGFTASTLDIPDSAFLNGGDLHFVGSSNEAIVNLGRIEASEGNIFLIAAKLENQGTLKAANGTVGLVAAKDVILTSNNQVFIQPVGESIGGTGIENAGVIEAAKAELQAQGNLYQLAINNSGVVNATSVVEEGGRILLRADGGRVSNSGTLTAQRIVGGKTIGGTIEVLAEIVDLNGNAVLNASGDLGGGQINIGGSYQGSGPLPNAQTTFVGDGVRIFADALDVGNGGTVIVWADGGTYIGGEIAARGGQNGGNGGFIETSGKENLVVSMEARINVSAELGLCGTWLLDPKNVIVGSSGSGTIADVSTFAAQSGNTISINVSALIGQGNIVIQATNDVTFTADLAMTGAATLTVQAGRDIIVNAGVAISTTNSNISFKANDEAVASNRDSGTGNITMGAGSSISSGTGSISLTLGSNAGGAGTIQVAALTTNGTAAGTISVNSGGGGITLNGNLSTDGGAATIAGAVTLTGPVTLGAAVTIDTDATATDANITFSGASSTVNGAFALVLNAGTGTITAGGDIGLLGALSSMSATGGSMSFRSVRTANGQTYTGPVSLNGDLISTTAGNGVSVSGTLTLTGNSTIQLTGSDAANDVNLAAVTGGFSLGITAGGGDVSISGTVGASALTTLTIAASGGTIDVQAVTTSGAQSYTGATTLNGTLTVNTAGAGVTVTGATTLATGGGAITLTGSNAANDVTLGTVNGAFALNILAGGGDVIVGVVGGSSPVASFTVNANTATITDVTTAGGVGGVVSVTAAGGISIGSTINTHNGGATAGAVTFTGPVLLINTLTVTTDATTTDANITFTSTITASAAGVQGLTLSAGTGLISVGGTVGATRLGAIQINSAGGVSFGAVTAASLTQSAGTGTTTFGGALNFNTATGLNVTSGIVNINGAVTTTNGGVVTITNSGLLTILAAADMSLDGAFTQNGAGLVTTGGDIATTNDAISFATAVTLSGNVLLDTNTGAGDVSFGSSVNGGFSLTITAGTGAVTLRQIGNTATQELTGLTVSGGSLTLHNDISTSGDGNGNVNFSGITGTIDIAHATGIVIDTDRTGGTGSAGAVNFGSAAVTGAGKTLSIQTVHNGGAGSDGAITLGAVGTIANPLAGLTLNSNGAGVLTLNGSIFVSGSSLSFTSVGAAIAVNGPITIDTSDGSVAGGDVNFTGRTLTGNATGSLSIDTSGTTNGIVTLQTVNLTASSGGLTVAGGALRLLGNISTDGGTVDFSGAASIRVDATLTIDTRTAAATAGNVNFGTVATNANAGGLNLTIDATGGTAGTVSLGAMTTATVLNQLTVSGGTINLNGSITTADFQLYTGAVSIAGGVSLTSNTTDLTITGNVTLAGGTVTLTSGLGAGDDIGITGTINGPATLNLNAGSGVITLGGVIGGGSPLTAFSATSSNRTDVGGNVTTSGTQTYTGPVRLTADATFTTTNNNVQFTSTVQADTNNAHDLAVNTGTGSISFGGTVGLTGTRFSTITLTTTGALTLNQGFFSTGLMTVNAAGVTHSAGTITAGSMTFNSSAGVTQAAAGGNLVLTGDLTLQGNGAFSFSNTANSVTGGGKLVTSGTTVDSIVFTTASAITTGTIQTDNGGLTVAHGAAAYTIDGNITLSGAFSETGTGNVTVASTAARTINTSATDSNIVFNNTITLNNNLTLNAGAGAVNLATSETSVSDGTVDTHTLSMTGNAFGTFTIGTRLNTLNLTTGNPAGITIAGTFNALNIGITTTDPAASLTVNANITANSLTLTSLKNVDIGGNITTTAGAAKLRVVSESLTQTGGVIDVTNLELESQASTTGNFTLNRTGNKIANATTTGSGVAGNITLVDDGGSSNLIITSLVTTNAGDVSINHGTNTLTINGTNNIAGSFSESGGGGVTLGGSLAVGAGENIGFTGTLTVAGNASLTVSGAGGLTLGAVNGTVATDTLALNIGASGTLTLNGAIGASNIQNITITYGNTTALTLNQNLTATGTITINSTGGVSQTAGVLTSNNLALGRNGATSGDWAMATSTNMVNNLSGTVAGDINFKNGKALNLNAIDTTNASVAGKGALTVDHGTFALTITGPINLKEGFTSTGAGTNTLAGSLTIGNGNITFSGTLGISGTATLTTGASGAISLSTVTRNASGDNLVLNAGTGGIALGGSIGASGNTGGVTLNTTGSVTQSSGTIFGGTLTIQGSGTFGTAGSPLVADVTNLVSSGSVGNVSISDSNGLTLGTFNAGTNTVRLTTTGTISGGTLTAGTVDLQGAGATYNITTSTGILTGNVGSGSVTVSNNTNITVNAITANGGISVTTTTAAKSITLGANLAPSAGTVVLNATGAIDLAGFDIGGTSATLTWGTVFTQNAGTFSTSTLTVNGAGTNTLTVGTIALGGTLSGTLNVVSTGNLTANGTLQAAGLSISSSGDVTLTTNLGNFAANLTGSGKNLTITNTGTLNITTVGSVSGITTTGGGDVTITSSNGVSQTLGASDRISTDVLTINGTGNFIVNNTSNAVASLTTGSGSLAVAGNPSEIQITVNASGITLNEIETTGVSGNLTVTTTGTVTVNGPLQLSGTFSQGGGGGVSLSGTLSAPSFNYSGAVTIANGTTITATTGGITFGSTVDAATAGASVTMTAANNNNIQFNGPVGVNGAGGITFGSISLNTSGTGQVIINDVIGDSTHRQGNITIVSAAVFTSSKDMYSSGTIDITANGITQSAGVLDALVAINLRPSVNGVNQTGGGIVTVGLGLIGTGGGTGFQMTAGTNTFTSLTSLAGSTTGNINLSTTSIVSVGTFNAGAGNVTLNVGGTTVGGLLTTSGTVSVTSSGNVALHTDIGTLVVSLTTSGSTLNINDDNGFAIGAGGVGGTNAAITINLGAGTLTSTGTVTGSSLNLTGAGTSYTVNTNIGTLTGTLTNGSGTVTIVETNALTLGTFNAAGMTVTLTSTGLSGGTLTAAGLVIHGSGGVLITTAVGRLESNASGAISVTNSGNLIIGGLTGPTVGVSTDGTIFIRANGGTLLIDEAVTTTGTTVTLESTGLMTVNANIGSVTFVSLNAGGINQTGGQIASNGLVVLGSGTFDLNGPTANSVNIIAVFIGSPLDFQNNKALTVGSVNGTTGINTTNGDLTLTTTAGAITLAADVDVGSARATFSGAGGLDQTGGSLTANQLVLRGGGAVSLTTASNAITSLAGNIGGGAGSTVNVYSGSGNLTIANLGVGADGLTTSGNVITIRAPAGVLTVNAPLNSTSVGGGTATTIGQVVVNVVPTGGATITLEGAPNPGGGGSGGTTIILQPFQPPNQGPPVGLGGLGALTLGTNQDLNGLGDLGLDLKKEDLGVNLENSIANLKFEKLGELMKDISTLIENQGGDNASLRRSLEEVKNSEQIMDAANSALETGSKAYGSAGDPLKAILKQLIDDVQKAGEDVKNANLTLAQKLAGFAADRMDRLAEDALEGAIAGLRNANDRLRVAAVVLHTIAGGIAEGKLTAEKVDEIMQLIDRVRAEETEKAQTERERRDRLKEDMKFAELQDLGKEEQKTQEKTPEKTPEAP